MSTIENALSKFVGLALAGCIFWSPRAVMLSRYLFRGGKVSEIHARRVVWLAVLLAMAGGVDAYEKPFPKYIEVDLTYRDPATGVSRTESGQLWFKDLPHRDPGGRVRGFGSLGYYDGIKWFVPGSSGDVWLERVADDQGSPVFFLKDPFGEGHIRPAFDRIDVVRTEDSSLETLMDQTLKQSLRPASEAPADDWLDDLSLEEQDPPAHSSPVLTGNAPEKGKGRDASPQRAPSPLRFATARDIGVREIALTDLQKIVFNAASDRLPREMSEGRFVSYSQQARGDEGRVQVRAATFWGGTDPGECIAWADLLPDGTILALGNYKDVDFIQPRDIVRVLGTDPAADAYPDIVTTDNRGRRNVREPRRTGVLAFIEPDLSRIRRVVRLPWGAGGVSAAVSDGNGPVYLTGQVGPHFDRFAKDVPRATLVEYPEHVESVRLENLKRTECKQAPRPLREDGFVVKYDPARERIEWVARFKHGGVNLFLRPDHSLWARRGDDMFVLTPDGEATRSATLERMGQNMAVDPRGGEIYFGGSYRSGTGLEPYVNPFLYKLDPAGRQVWTAWGWSGPILGVEPLRLVSDSSVTQIQVGEDGSLTVTGWSDGGNTALSHQPYDMRKVSPTRGFCSEVWGATGGLTVRIAHILHMDPHTMQVDHCTKYIAYFPSSDVPALLNIYDIHRTANGDVGVTGAARRGYVETWDAWIPSWYVQSRTNRFAQGKGGTFFTLFPPDFGPPRMATRTPGVSGGRLAGRGNLLLLYGAANSTDPDSANRDYRPYDQGERTIVKNAFQPRSGGGMDGYLMLIDTQGPPNPPSIPAKTWDVERKGGRR